MRSFKNADEVFKDLLECYWFAHKEDTPNDMLIDGTIYAKEIFS